MDENGTNQIMKYLFLGAHTDDIELCAGGTVAKLIELNNDVHFMAFSSCQSEQIETEWNESLNILRPSQSNLAYFKNRLFSENRQDILDRMIQLRDNIEYDYVFTHSTLDGHQDHRVIGQESIRAFKNTNLITYIAPWNQIGSQPIDNYFVSLELKHVQKKIESCMAYKSQINRPYMNEDFLWAQARIAGIKCQSEFAEAFQVLKIKA